MYVQLGCVQVYSIEGGLLANLVRLKSPAVKIYAFNLGISVGLGVGVELKLDVKLRVELLASGAASASGASSASSCCSTSELGSDDKDSSELMFIVLKIRIECIKHLALNSRHLYRQFGLEFSLRGDGGSSGRCQNFHYDVTTLYAGTT